MRRLMPVLVLAPLALALLACAPEEEKETVTEADSCATEDLPLRTPGTLTIGTDSPAYPPWFEDNKPANGKGYESAVAYAVADQLGFDAAQVKWVKVPFNSSYAPTEKKFDFDINQVSITPARQKAVDFSDGYYTAAQAVITLKAQRRQGGLAGRPEGPQARRPDRHHEPDRNPRGRRADAGAAGVPEHQHRQTGVAERPGGRDRRRPADGVHHHGRRDPDRARSRGSSTRPVRPRSSAC